MSTILKALKRIDQTTPPPEDLQAWPPKIDTRRAVRARVKKIWLYRKIYLVLVLTVILIAAGWLAYSQKHHLASRILPRKTAANGPIYQAKIQPVADKSRNSSPEKEPIQENQNARPGTASGHGPVGADRPSTGLHRLPAPQERQKSPIFMSADRTRSRETHRTVKSNPSRPPPAAISEKTARQDTRPSAAAPETRSNSRVEPVARSYRRLDESKLKLQAIAWSRDASRRIAVINGRILREGESVDGYVVNQIREENVVVNDGTASWQLEFGLKQ